MGIPNPLNNIASDAKSLLRGVFKMSVEVTLT